MLPWPGPLDGYAAPAARRTGALRLPPSETPYKIAEGDIVFWLVYIDGEFMAFNPLTPHDRAQRCEYLWNVANRRFEDPCLGAKFMLDGTYIEGPALRNLDRYRLRLSGDEVVIVTSRLISRMPVEESGKVDGR